jgi:hypothetical protein
VERVGAAGSLYCHWQAHESLSEEIYALATICNFGREESTLPKPAEYDLQFA